jgi:hypothetical protein
MLRERTYGSAIRLSTTSKKASSQESNGIMITIKATMRSFSTFDTNQHLT